MTSEALALEVVAARGGDRDAFARLVSATRNLVCSLTLAIARDVQASEDLAQEVFLAAWAGLPRLRAPESFLPWLRQLARNRAHEHVRGRVRWRRRHAAWQPAADARPDPSALPGDRLAADEEREALARALEALSSEAREIVTLYYRQGRSARQVADLLGLSEDAVKKRLERARTTLRETLLLRFGEAARKSAPDAAFTVAVAAALAAWAPATASAALVAGGAGAKVKLLVLLAAVGGAMAGLASGLAGIWLGLSLEGRRALDEQERRELRRLGVRASLLAVLAVAGMMAGIWLGRRGHAAAGAALLSAAYLAYVIGLARLYGRDLPRILARRHAAEVARDPSAARRHRRRARLRRAGLVLTVGCGLASAAVFTLLMLQR
jgi:RNA polymerase sigma factor (sigma-70 family)